MTFPIMYRVYVKDLKKVCPIYTIDFVEDCCNVHIDEKGTTILIRDCLDKLEKFSGEYDKKGNPIYEKDILKVDGHCCGDYYHEKYLGEVSLDNEHWVGSDYDYGDSLFDCVHNYGCEVIGNSSENPKMIDLYYAEITLDKEFPIKGKKS